MDAKSEDKVAQIIKALIDELGNVVTIQLIEYIKSIWEKKNDN